MQNIGHHGQSPLAFDLWKIKVPSESRTSPECDDLLFGPLASFPDGQTVAMVTSSQGGGGRLSTLSRTAELVHTLLLRKSVGGNILNLFLSCNNINNNNKKSLLIIENSSFTSNNERNLKTRRRDVIILNEG